MISCLAFTFLLHVCVCFDGKWERERNGVVMSIAQDQASFEFQSSLELEKHPRK